MVPSSRFGIAAVRTSLQPNFRAGFICAQCRRRASTAIPKAASSAPKPFPPRRYASSSFADNFTDKLRKKIWGTDTPPGQEDPYGPPSLLDQKRRQAEERESDEESEKAAKVPVTTEEPEEDPNYVPATTWDGLDTVGGPNWGMDVWDEENPFEGFVYQSKNDAGQERELIWSKRFMEPVKLGSREEVVAAVHRALVEVWTLKQSGMPLAMDTNPRDPTDDYEYRIASDVRFEKGADGDMALVYATEALQQEIIESIAPKNAVVKEAEEFEVGDVEEEMEDDVLGSSEGVRESSAEAIAPEEMRSERALEMDNMDDTSTEDVEKLENDLDMDPEPPTPVDQGWHEVPFGNADLKFAVGCLRIRKSLCKPLITIR